MGFVRIEGVRRGKMVWWGGVMCMRLAYELEEKIFRRSVGRVFFEGMRDTVRGIWGYGGFFVYGGERGLN